MKRRAAICLRYLLTLVEPIKAPPANRRCAPPKDYPSFADECTAMKAEQDAEIARAELAAVNRIGAEVYRLTKPSSRKHSPICNSQFGTRFACTCGLANVEPVCRLVK